ncbi:MAG: amidohydrolase family protein [Anaerolineae bacterium]|nr:amidohydrolase family protein [Anaerolineae bacterium]
MIDFTNLAQRPIIDSHVHFIHPECMDEMLALFDTIGYRAANLVCLPNPNGSTQNDIAFAFKKQYPNRIFVSGAVEYRLLLEQPERFAADLPRQVRALIGRGFDGMKMIEGKPNVRKMVNLRLDDPAYDGLWETVEQEQFPLLLHIADPDFFWDPESCPDWARKNGWDYTDGSYPSKSALYTEVDHILARFPRIRMTLAHFKFMSTDLEAADAFLAKHPSVSFDLAPHLDMYFDFSANATAARTFFIKHSDRILYGTDLDTRVLKRGPDGNRFMRSVASLIRRFLEWEGPFRHTDGKMVHALNLPDDVLDKIYFQNFERIYSTSPSPGNYPSIMNS